MTQAWRRANDNYYLAGSLGLNMETLLTRHVPCWNTGHYAHGTVTRDKKKKTPQGGPKSRWSPQPVVSSRFTACALSLRHGHVYTGLSLDHFEDSWWRNNPLLPCLHIVFHLLYPSQSTPPGCDLFSSCVCLCVHHVYFTFIICVCQTEDHYWWPKSGVATPSHPFPLYFFFSVKRV